MNAYQIKKIWKFILLLIAAGIGFASLLYTNKLVDKLAEEESKKIELWVEANKLLVSDVDENIDLGFVINVVRANTTIPIIDVDEDGNIYNTRNLDSALSEDSNYLREQLEIMKEQNEPIEYMLVEGQKHYLYYKNSVILTQLKYYPYYQLSIIALFLLVSYGAFSYSRKNEQNQVWVGMSKETAHQLGTPISSLMAWIDYMRVMEGKVEEENLDEMMKDITRLQLVTDRFSKIGSAPVLEENSVPALVEHAVGYLKNRTSDKVKYTINVDLPLQTEAMINVPLFDWVLENICKNAIDAMEGEGKIDFHIIGGSKHVTIDIADTGKGIPSGKVKTIFKPGFTTKKRGWGLGLSLAKRIINNYHKGNIFVKNSVPNKGTTFRIVLRRPKR